ncbi:MAG TPA: hypothetical protein VK889_04180 [Solirubrobacterales bacterium]|nr:hypothetical protein [Solirubrobacterales bacterium]
MGLSGDQKALLRLLAQREQGYDDIAALMGLSVEEVRARVKDALDAVEREGGETPPPPVEKKEAPKKPAPKTEPPKPSKPAPAAKPPRGGSTLPKERRVMAIAGGLAAVVLVIVLLATGVIGGDSGDSSDAGSGGGEETSQTTSSELRSTEEALSDSNLTGAVLRPVDGGDASGAALFGKTKKQILLQVEASGLEPSPQGSSYAIWLYKSPELALRVGAVELGEDEEGIRVQLPLPEEALGTVAAGLFDQISVSLTDNAEYKAAVAKAKRGQDFPSYTGTEVLRGPIQGPIANVAAEAQQQRGKGY